MTDEITTLFGSFISPRREARSCEVTTTTSLLNYGNADAGGRVGGGDGEG